MTDDDVWYDCKRFLVKIKAGQREISVPFFWAISLSKVLKRFWRWSFQAVEHVQGCLPK